jgi:hypothetical protein
MPTKRPMTRRARPAKSTPESPAAVAKEIDARVRNLSDWRGEKLARFRALIREVDPQVVEEIKWRKPSDPAGVPVWSHNGIICVANVWKGHARLTFPNGALLKDPKHVFNAALNGNYMRALDLEEGETFDEAALVALVRAAIALNDSA